MTRARSDYCAVRKTGILGLAVLALLAAATLLSWIPAGYALADDTGPALLVADDAGPLIEPSAGPTTVQIVAGAPTQPASPEPTATVIRIGKSDSSRHAAAPSQQDALLRLTPESAVSGMEQARTVGQGASPEPCTLDIKSRPKQRQVSTGDALGMGLDDTRRVAGWRARPLGLIQVPPGGGPSAASLSSTAATGPMSASVRPVSHEEALAKPAVDLLRPSFTAEPLLDGLRPATQGPESAKTDPKSVGPLDVIGQMPELTVTLDHGKLLRSRLPVSRVTVADSTYCGVMPSSPREISIVGKQCGATPVTFWFKDSLHEPLTCLVRVVSESEGAADHESTR